MDDLVAQGLGLAVVGMSVVFVALVVTGTMVGWIGRLFKEKAPVPATAPLPQESLGGIDKKTILLISAAATAVLYRPVRIRRVRFVTPLHAPAAWKTMGRAAVHTTRNVKMR